MRKTFITLFSLFILSTSIQAQDNKITLESFCLASNLFNDYSLFNFGILNTTVISSNGFQISGTIERRLFKKISLAVNGYYSTIEEKGTYGPLLFSPIQPFHQKIVNQGIRLQVRGYLKDQMKGPFGGIYTRFNNKKHTDFLVIESIPERTNYFLFGGLIGYSFINKKGFTIESVLGYGGNKRLYKDDNNGGIIETKVIDIMLQLNIGYSF